MKVGESYLSNREFGCMLGSNREGIMNEADTCRTYVLPKLKSAGWEDELRLRTLLPFVLDRAFKGEL